jgi:hypothetical protein
LVDAGYARYITLLGSFLLVFGLMMASIREGWLRASCQSGQFWFHHVPNHDPEADSSYRICLDDSSCHLHGISTVVDSMHVDKAKSTAKKIGSVH